MLGYKQVSLNERVQIEKWLDHQVSIRETGRRVGWVLSTVSGETPRRFCRAAGGR